jgi:hypothetical protein
MEIIGNESEIVASILSYDRIIVWNNNTSASVKNMRRY